jgi:hypothetical protein
MAQWRRGKVIEIKVPAEHRQRLLVLLQEISVSRTRGISEVERSKLLLAALADSRGACVAKLEGQFPELGMARREIESRLRWMAECLRKLPPEPVHCKALHEVLRRTLADRPRSGAKRKITPEQQAAIIKMALQPPKTYALPFPRWSAPDLTAQVIKAGVIAKLSVSKVQAILNQQEIDTRRCKVWLNANIDDKAEHDARIAKVGGTYVAAPNLAKEGIIVDCLDEKTGIPAHSRIHPDKPPRPGDKAKIEAEYKRNGVLALISVFTVATGKIPCFSIGPTRTEDDFAKLIRARVMQDPDKRRIFIADQLNTHKSESLVLLIIELCGLDISAERLGVKGKSGILESQETRMAFLEDESHAIRFLYTPKHCSWMNQIEIWFGQLSRKGLKGGSFESTKVLQEHIEQFIAFHNDNLAHPYAWTYTGKILSS